jgi:hypothetical protein
MDEKKLIVNYEYDEMRDTYSVKVSSPMWPKFQEIFTNGSKQFGLDVEFIEQK